MLSFLIPLLVATGTPSIVRVASTAPPVSCASTNGACAQFENESTGSALRAVSTGGVGFVATSSSGNYLYPGLDGEGANAGTGAGAAFGLNFLSGSSAPTYGVLAYGVLDGLYGATENNGSSPNASSAGVFGQDDGASSFPDYNAGVLGDSSVGTGVVGESNGSSPSSQSQFGIDRVGAWAVAHTSQSETGTIGLVAESDTIPLYALVPASGGTGYVALASATAGAMIVAGDTGSGSGFFDVDLNGNGLFSGAMKTKKGTYARTAGASGAHRLTYGLRGRSPLIEDVGEAELTNGRASVALDPALADSLDMRRPYHVLVTPEGECKQLYVTQKSPGGFVVREADGGRSTVAFAYRIVGKPFDDDGTAFAAQTRAAASAVRGSGSGGGHVGTPLSPEARLRRGIGAERYARMLRDARAVDVRSRTGQPASPATSVTCSNTTECLTYNNTSTGSGLSASSAGAIGVTALSGSEAYQAPGIDGESNDVTGTDAAAAFGLDFLTMGSAPTYGALAYGSVNGLYGATEAGGQTGGDAAGVFGQDTLASLSNTDPRDYNEGVLGSSSAGTGVLAESNGVPAAGLFGTVPIGIYAVGDMGNLQRGDAYGVVAEGNDVALEAEIPEPNEYVDLVRTTSSGFDLIHAANLGGFYSFVVTSGGTGTFSGTITTSKGTYARTTGASGAVRVAYGSREAAPEVEGVGEGHLVDGRAFVALDPVLADAIDMRRPYVVSVTAEGNSGSLYVAERTPAGFVVGEAHGGRSTLAFDYRIVGTPVDDDARRLAAASPPPMPERPARGPRIARPLSPSARALASKGSL